MTRDLSAAVPGQPSLDPAPHPAAAGRVRGAVAPAIVVALLGALGVGLLWRVFVDTFTGQAVERATLQGAQYGQNRLWDLAEPLLDVVSVAFIAAVLLTAVLIAVVRRRWVLAVQVGVVMVGANLSAQLLKDYVLPRPSLGVSGPDWNTLPSGHTTAAASISVVLVLVVPALVRPWVAGLAALYTAATGVSTLGGQWHRPSDVIAAVLLVLAWSAVACAVVARHPDRADDRVRAAGSERSTAAAGRTRAAAGTLATVGLLAAVPAALALSRLWLTVGGAETRAQLLTAYAGGASAVISVSFLAFAALLVIHQAATARTRTA